MSCFDGPFNAEVMALLGDDIVYDLSVDPTRRHPGLCTPPASTPPYLQVNPLNMRVYVWVLWSQNV